MNNKRALLIIIITIILVGIIGFLSLNLNNSSTTLENDVINIPQEFTNEESTISDLKQDNTGEIILDDDTLSDSDADSNWLTFEHTEFGFNFNYPSSWEVQNGLDTQRCCLNVFNTKDPYALSERLHPDIMKAQFQYNVTKVQSMEDYIEKLLTSHDGTGPVTGPVYESSLQDISNNSNTKIIKFSGGVGNVGYIIPLKEDFSEILYIIVWNPDSIFDELLETFQFEK